MAERLDHILEEHREIVGMLARIEKITSQDTCGDLLIELGEVIAALDDALRAHFAREEKSELFTALPDEFPRFERVMAHLKVEHESLTERVAALRAAFEDDPASHAADLCGDARALVESLRDHEQAGRDIVQQAYGDDIGALD